MKKQFIFLLLILTLLLTGCPAPAGTQNEPTIPPEGESGLQGETPTNDPSIENSDRDALNAIICRAADSFTESAFALYNGQTVINLTIPAEWDFVSDGNGGYTVQRDGLTIGSLYGGAATDMNVWTNIFFSEYGVGDMLVYEYIDKDGEGESLRFRCRYTFMYMEGLDGRDFTLTVDYAEVDPDTAMMILYENGVTDISKYTRLGTLSSLRDSRLLLLGNSFINSSQIGSILTSLMEENGKNCSVRAISRGYATVATYVQDSILMNEIASGSYDAVFICGFYSEVEITHLRTLKQTCDASNTRLILLPAHNESRSVIDSACVAFPALDILDWKAELDALIEGGIDKWHLCVADMHEHSTSAAGYVGAHMIYRAIYGEVPNDRVMISELLRDYAAAGFPTSVLPFEKIYFLRYHT